MSHERFNDRCIAQRPKAKPWHSLLIYPVIIMMLVLVWRSLDFKLQIDYIVFAGMLVHISDIGLTHLLAVRQPLLAEREVNPLSRFFWARYGLTWGASILGGIPTVVLTFFVLSLPYEQNLRLIMVGLFAFPLVMNPITYWFQFRREVEGN